LRRRVNQLNHAISANNITDATRTAVLPGKQGQVLIMDYYRKAKRLDVHFEKLN
jgi:hypothetical protein